MPARSLTRRAAAVAVAATSAALILTGCGDDPDDSGSGDAAADESRPSVEVDDELAARVPDEIGEDGTITVGTDSSYAPSEFIDEDGETIIGFDVDLFSAVAEKIGFEAEFESASFDSIIAGVRLGPVRGRRLLVHDQPRAPGRGDDGQLLLRRHPVGHPGGQPRGRRPRQRLRH